MPIKRRLLRESITYSQAKDKETNVLHQLTLWQRQNEFFNHIHRCSKLIEDQVTRHLGSPSGTCQIADQKEWMHGSFNLCVPVSVLNSRPVLMRFPLPYRIGDESFAGNGDEKVRCEAGAYTWLQQEAPTVRIAHLHGFGLSNGKYVRPQILEGEISAYLETVHFSRTSFLLFPIASTSSLLGPVYFWIRGTFSICAL